MRVQATLSSKNCRLVRSVRSLPLLIAVSRAPTLSNQNQTSPINAMKRMFSSTVCYFFIEIKQFNQCDVIRHELF